MAHDKPFKRIRELLQALTEAERELERGALDLSGLDAASDDARELYERLVVLRHKARETARTPPPAASNVLPLAADPGVTAIRLDTRPEIRQTSLIDAIAETEDGSGRKRKKQPAEAPEHIASLGEKFGNTPIPQLGKAIALSQKFWFTAALFGGDRQAYESGVQALDAAGTLEKARTYLETEVLPKLKKEADPDALAAFTDLLERRYP